MHDYVGASQTHCLMREKVSVKNETGEEGT
jgi:hypothetical protein